jgi:hypothetical protein
MPDLAEPEAMSADDGGIMFPAKGKQHHIEPAE